MASVGLTACQTCACTVPAARKASFSAELTARVALAASQPSVYTVLAARQPPDSAALTVHLVSADCQPSAFTTPAAPQPSSANDVITRVPCCSLTFGLYSSSCLAASGFDRPHGIISAAACQPSDYTAIATRQPPAFPISRPLLSLLLGSLRLWRNSRPLVALAFCHLSAYRALVARRRPSLLPVWPRCLSVLSPYGPCHTEVFVFGRPHGPRSPAAR